MVPPVWVAIVLQGTVGFGEGAGTGPKEEFGLAPAPPGRWTA